MIHVVHNKCLLWIHVLFFGLHATHAAWASPSTTSSKPTRQHLVWRRAATSVDNEDLARQFKIVTCNASACAEKRKRLNLEEYATFSALYVRAQAYDIDVEETSCLGACQQAPCVGVQHQDYVGTVALQGMTEAEFANRVFFRIIDDDDAERVWQCVQNGIQFMKDAATQDDDNEQDRTV